MTGRQLSSEEIGELIDPLGFYGGKKRCSKCGEIKPKAQFNARASSKDGLKADCYSCNKKARKSRYSTREADNQAARAFKARLRAVVSAYKTASGCENCGYNAHSAALDLHHVGDKKETVSQLVSKGSLRSVVEELQNCIVLCANCHRIKTFVKDGELSLIKNEKAE